MAERELLVRIVGDDRDLQRALGNTDKSLKRIDSRTAAFGKNVKTAFAAAGVTLGAGVVLRGINSTVEAASGLNEQISRTEVVLGDSADAMIAWSKTTASAMGISQREALAASATFAGLFQTTGVAQAQAGEFSRVLVKLASDLASLQDTSPEEALVAIRSGLAGEAEPLRRYNIFLSEAVVQQRALTDTGKKAASALTLQEKTQARYNIILEQGAVAQDNFKNTSGELANQQRTARAELEDLSASVGQIFIPSMEAAVGTAGLFAGSMNDAITATIDFKKALSDTTAFDGWNAGVETAASSAGGFFDRIRDGIPLLGDLRTAIIGVDFGGIGDTPEGTGRRQGGADALDNFREGQRRQQELLTEGERAVADTQKAFEAFAKGMGLKLDKARLTESTSDDLEVLRELEAAINRRIVKEGKTFQLVSRLTQTRQQIADIVEGQATDAANAAQDAFQATIDALDLKLDIAKATTRLEDDQKVLREIEQAILKRIKTEGKTTELLRKLFDVRQEQKQAAQDLRDQKDFLALGLTAEGDKRGPSARNLLKRTETLEDRLKGTALDTPATRAKLEKIKNVLKSSFKDLGKGVASAILEMLNDISSAFKDGTDDVQSTSMEITRGGIRSTKKLTEGLGLTPEQIEAIRKRNRGGLGGGATAFGFGVGGRNDPTGIPDTGGFRDAQGEAQIDLHIFLDGKELEHVVTKRQQRNGQRSAASRRGRHGGRNLGLG